MRINGKDLGEQIRAELASRIDKLYTPPVLTVIIAQENFVVRKFVDIKRSFADSIGVTVREEKLAPLSTQQDLLQKIFHATQGSDGIIVQLPLPPQMEAEEVRQIIPASHDVDLLGATAYEEFANNRIQILPPVVGAINEIVTRNHIELRGKNIAVIGEGRLVGAPASVWAKRMGGKVTVHSRTSLTPEALLDADVIISGAGSPALVTPLMIKEGAVLLDAGTSEQGGKLVGDIDPACEAKAALFTPTPGGIGPITVAMIFKNLLSLMDLRRADDLPPPMQ